MQSFLSSTCATDVKILSKVCNSCCLSSEQYNSTVKKEFSYVFMNIFLDCIQYKMTKDALQLHRY